MARSYGPGRYDTAFEERGLDYPIGYVRWTETRNMEAFLHLAAEGKVTPLSLVTHCFRIEEASKAYEALLSEAAPRPLGMLISYPEESGGVAPLLDLTRREIPHQRRQDVAKAAGARLGVGFIGAGAFARSTLLPALGRLPRLQLRTVITAHGLTALDAQRRFGFERIGTDPEHVFSDPEIQLVVIATRHDRHADLVIRALEAGKHVFVEKPLALNEEQLARVEQVASDAPGVLMVGFNRRFSPQARALRHALARAGPLMMVYRITAGPLPSGHWLLDPDIGGGRIIGEGCHFVDLMSYLAGDMGIVSIQAHGRGGLRNSRDDVSALLSFSDGSLGNLLYTTQGSSLICKELLEVHAGCSSACIQDFLQCTLWQGRRRTKVRGSGKGHTEELVAWAEAVRKGGPPPIPIRALFEVTRATFAIQRALVGGPTAELPEA
jgi:predicted dehydrogenase